MTRRVRIEAGGRLVEVVGDEPAAELAGLARALWPDTAPAEKVPPHGAYGFRLDNAPPCNACRGFHDPYDQAERVESP